MQAVDAGKVYLEGIHKTSPERIPEKLREFHTKMQEYIRSLFRHINVEEDSQFQQTSAGHQPTFLAKEHLFKNVKQLSRELGGEILSDKENVEAYFEALILKGTSMQKIKFFKMTASIRDCENAIFRFNQLAEKLANKSLDDPFAL